MKLLTIGALAMVISPAYAHDALPTAAQPEGWTYGWECCNLRDCRRLEHHSIRETSAGYLVKATEELIPYGDKRVKRSRDEFFHQCTPAGDPKAKRSICLYVPDRGF